MGSCSFKTNKFNFPDDIRLEGGQDAGISQINQTTVKIRNQIDEVSPARNYFETLDDISKHEYRLYRVTNSWARPEKGILKPSREFFPETTSNFAPVVHFEIQDNDLKKVKPLLDIMDALENSEETEFEQ